MSEIPASVERCGQCDQPIYLVAGKYKHENGNQSFSRMNGSHQAFRKGEMKMARHVDRPVLGSEEENLVPLPITDDRNQNPGYAAWADESGGLPPLDERKPFYREACAEWTSKVPEDKEWNPFEVRLIEDRVQRDHQLKASLLREKGLRELLSRIYMSTASGHDSGYVRLYVERGTFKEIEAVFLKAAVTGE